MTNEELAAEMRNLATQRWAIVYEHDDLFREVAAALTRPEAGSRWVPCSEDVPPFDQLVIAWSPPYGAVLADRTTSNPDRGWSCCGDGVTHWMPLPSAPLPQKD